MVTQFHTLLHFSTLFNTVIMRSGAYTLAEFFAEISKSHFSATY